MTVTEQVQAEAFLLHPMLVGLTASPGGQVSALVEDIQPLADPVELAQAKGPVYAHIQTIAGAVDDPRAVTTFTDSATLRVYRVLKYDERTSGAFYNWTAEASRL